MNITIVMELHFYLRFHTSFGETLWVSGNIEELGLDDPETAIAMEYLNDAYWNLSISITGKKNWPNTGIRYKYFLKNKDAETINEWGNDRLIEPPRSTISEMRMIDTWNHAGEYENAFFTTPFKDVLFKYSAGKIKTSGDKNYTHSFRIKAPLLKKNEAVCLLGNGEALGDWSMEKAVRLVKKENWWIAEIDLSKTKFPIAYKYAILNTKDSSDICYETGDNRLIINEAAPGLINIIHDGFINLPNDNWKGAGVAIPVFSLKSKDSFGVGEFTDIKLLVDWARQTGLKLIQLLPVNDTIATNTWVDSYPYAAISAFAMHPLYINLSEVAGKKHADKINSLKKKQKILNGLTEVDYEEVMRFKLAMLREIYDVSDLDFLNEGEYQLFFDKNKHWLKPYAAFCYFRDKFKSSHFDEWKTNSAYNSEEIENLFNLKTAVKKELLFYCFVQYHLHLQLKSAADYAHKKEIVLKGDIPIGIYRHGCDAWVAPWLYNMNEQAGAPPDFFTPIGQNWEFPTYNWKRMQEDGFSWWKLRFEQMSDYFDAFRIDHILGFFRIWSIPSHAVQGIMGHFVPCLPIHYKEFGENGLWFDEQRYCKPFINDEVIYQVFGELSDRVKSSFLVSNDFSSFDLKPEYDTQRKVEAYFAKEDDDEVSERLKNGLYQLISNIIFFKQEGSNGLEFHFRISMENTLSFKYLIPHVQEKLKELYINYFYRRQDEFWKKEAMHKLPFLKEATNMLICGEDLGMVPHCVPEVMKQLGILSLEIQRMPKDPATEFFVPDQAPYLSVITPSTHDMSTVRGWWEEDRSKTQRFFNQVLGQWGNAPYFCEPWVNRAIILQHLYSRAMWSIFQLQDIMGMGDTIRRESPQAERINDPANGKHYWRYRMHIFLEELINENDFNKELKGYITHSGR